MEKMGLNLKVDPDADFLGDYVRSAANEIQRLRDAERKAAEEQRERDQKLRAEQEARPHGRSYRRV